MSRSALTEKPFAIFMVGHLVSLHGFWIQRVAQGWLAWELTHSEFWVGVIAFSQLVPIVVFGPLFGVWADRVDRKWAAILVNALAVLSAGLLAALTLADRIDIERLTALAALQGLVQAAYTPVRMALLPNLVHPERLASALAINAVAYNISQFIGPALSGIIIAAFSVGIAFAVNAITYLASIATLLVIEVHSESPRPDEPASVASDLAGGIRYAWNHESTRTFLGLSVVMAFFGRGVLELMPAIADVLFSRGSNGLAALTAAVGAGALVASAWMSRGRIRHFRRIAAAGVIIALSLTILLAWTSNIVIGLALVCGIGMSLSFSGVSLQTLIQSTLDDRYRGRVMSLWGVVIFGGVAAGGLCIGAAARLAGLGVATFAAGIVGLIAASLITWYIFASGKTRPISAERPAVTNVKDPLH